MTLEQALDRSWQVMADCFEPSELLLKKSLLDEFLPAPSTPTGP
jgi:V/A-type H+-transporting ATPase subunit B